MKIIDTIRTEADRYEAFYGHKPDYAFIGKLEWSEIQDKINEVIELGYPVKDEGHFPFVSGMYIYPSPCLNGIIFGQEQPSPCG